MNYAYSSTFDQFLSADTQSLLAALHTAVAADAL